MIPLSKGICKENCPVTAPVPWFIGESHDQPRGQIAAWLIMNVLVYLKPMAFLVCGKVCSTRECEECIVIRVMRGSKHWDSKVIHNSIYKEGLHYAGPCRYSFSLFLTAEEYGETYTVRDPEMYREVRMVMVPATQTDLCS